jgi:hypothetical protein
MQTTATFQQILEAFAAALAPGVESLRGELLFYFQVLLFFEMLRTCYAFLYSGDLLQGAMATLGRGALVFWALANFPQVLQWTQETFVSLGLLAGGDRLTPAQFLDPGQYIAMGIRVMALLYSSMTASFSLLSIPQAFGYLLLWIVFMAAFAVLAVNVAIWQVELLIAGVGAMVLLPALTFRSWAWMAQGALSLTINLCFRFFLGALLASLTFPLLERLTITTPVSFQSVAVSVIGGWLFAFLFTRVNSMASHFLSGMASLTAGTVVSAAAGSAVTVGAAVSGVGAVGGAALAGGATAARGGLLASQAMTGHGGALAGRMGTLAGASGRTALGQGQRSLRQLVNVGSYVGGDHPGVGVRR